MYESLMWVHSGRRIWEKHKKMKVGKRALSYKQKKTTRIFKNENESCWKWVIVRKTEMLQKS